MSTVDLSELSNSMLFTEIALPVTPWNSPLHWHFTPEKYQSRKYGMSIHLTLGHQNLMHIIKRILQRKNPSVIRKCDSIEVQ